MRPYTVKIPAGDSYPLRIGRGDYIRVNESAQAIRFENPQNGENVELQEGDDANLSRFEELRLSHKAAGEIEAVIYIGNGTRAGSSRVGGDVGIKQATGPVLSGAAVSDVAAEIMASDATRRLLHVRNKGPQPAYIGPAGVTPATAAIVLEPGEELRETDAAPAAWYAVADTGATTTLALMEA